MIVNSKSAKSSKVVIINALVILAGIITALSGADIPYVSAALSSGAAVSVLGAINLILRFFTKQPVTVSGGEPVVVDDTPKTL